MAVALRERADQFEVAVERRLAPENLADVLVYLERRLERSQNVIADAREAGEDVRDLERRWSDWLRAYERLSDLATSAGR